MLRSTEPVYKKSLYSSKKEGGFDIMVKLIIIGDSGVGKTNILTRFCHNIFKQSHVATIGVDFNVKIMEIEGIKIKMQVWDTAGQERFKTITETYYNGAAGIIVVYSVDQRQSFNNVRKWVDQVNQKVPPNIPKILVANKIDLFQTENTESGNNLPLHPENTPSEKITKQSSSTQEDDGLDNNLVTFQKNKEFFNSLYNQREVSKAQGQALAAELNMNYLQVSAKYNTQIYDIFHAIGKQIVRSPQNMQENMQQTNYRKILVGSKMSYEHGTKRVKISEHGSRDNCAC